jgi:hypothetical protein
LGRDCALVSSTPATQSRYAVKRDPMRESSKVRMPSRRHLGQPGRSIARKPAGHPLQGFPASAGSSRLCRARDLSGMRRGQRSFAARPGNKRCRIAGITGATGLEPATSGVTGRHGATGYSRLRAGISRWSRHSLDSRTGCDRVEAVPPGTACVVGVWSGVVSRATTPRRGLCVGCAISRRRG